MKLNLRIWRQNGQGEIGKLVVYHLDEVTGDMSFLEMLDLLNQRLILSREPPVAFDHDCREGICGSCGFMINGVAHGPQKSTTVCQLFMRRFRDGETLVIEPFRARAFPVIKDLVVDRREFDSIIQAGGFISASTGHAPDANSILVPKERSDRAMDAAACIGCGACVAACPNGSAMLFIAAKVSHLAVLPQGRVEAAQRVCVMTEEMLGRGFGNCGNHYECQAVCPKGIKVRFIARLNREFIKAKIT